MGELAAAEAKPINSALAATSTHNARRRPPAPQPRFSPRDPLSIAQFPSFEPKRHCWTNATSLHMSAWVPSGHPSLLPNLYNSLISVPLLGKLIRGRALPRGALIALYSTSSHAAIFAVSGGFSFSMIGSYLTIAAHQRQFGVQSGIGPQHCTTSSRELDPDRPYLARRDREARRAKCDTCCARFIPILFDGRPPSLDDRPPRAQNCLANTHLLTHAA